ncbi:MAG: hemolysin family protein [Hyphomicrobiaceae bacterium]
MTDLLIVLALIFANGLFALSELAVVSARRSRLKALSAAGRRGAESAIRLAEDPGRFLSAVQIGITLIGIVNGAYSGEAFGQSAAALLEDLGMPARVAAPLGYGIVIALVTYLSVIIGELVPKTLALRRAEAIAATVAPFMTAFSRLAGPVVWLLDRSTRLVFRLFGQSLEPQALVSDEEIRALIAEAESAGVIERGEREMIAGVMRLADRAVIGLMTPRLEVVWLDLAASESEIQARLMSAGHSRLPVGEGSTDALIGVVQTRDLLAVLVRGERLDLRQYVRKAAIVPDSTKALDVLAILREAEMPMALIHDEYGDFEGIVTPADILEAIVGAFRSDRTGREPRAIERDDGSWLLSGSMAADEMAETIAITLPQQRNYETVAGFVLAHLMRLPQTGEHVDVAGWRFEVVDLDGRRIDKVLASPRPSPTSPVPRRAH